MRITYIHQHFCDPGESGGARPYEFARRLAARGHRVTVIAGGTRSRRYELDGFAVIRVAAPYDNMMSKARRMASFAQFMASSTLAAARVDADVVFASSTPLTVAVPGIIAALRRRARFVLEIRDLWPTVPIELGYLPPVLHGPAKALERTAYQRADEVIALSPWMADGVRKVAPAASVSTIPNCSDSAMQPQQSREAVRAKFNIPPEALLFCYAGSLGVGYDPDWLADLAAGLRSAGARLVVAGDGAGRASAIARLSSHGTNGEETFIGAIPRSEVFDLLHASNACVSSLINHPVLEHNSLNKVFDALATGTPVIFNHGGWLCDLVTDRSAGWRWPREIDASNISTMLAGLTPAALSQAAAAAAQLGREQFDRDTLFEEFHQVVTGSVIA